MKISYDLYKFKTKKKNSKLIGQLNFNRNIAILNY